MAEDEEDDANSCIQDPGPSDGKLLDAFVGISPAPTAPQLGPFGNEKGGGLPQTFGDDVVVVAGIGDSLSDEEGCHCVDELQGLKIKEEVDHKDADQQDNAVRQVRREEG
ncbi:uncharacterized protein LOC122091377 isoform X2 [Macadamia integrifolia]|uniref:uncharacterized protein LOC122091377 isoform X2 n=1 Tax=Macadamia integrifolia TaxID=60698 RepID=UPI001C4F9830|nr:uncharacterized protein LOC122091377 isoform X2 [Macadamia integrifolia]